MTQPQRTTVKQDGVISPPHAPGCYPGNDPSGIAQGINQKPNPANGAEHQHSNTVRAPEGGLPSVPDYCEPDPPGYYPSNFPTPHGRNPRNSA